MYNNPRIKAPTKTESIVIKIMVVVGVLSILTFLYFFFDPEYQGYFPLYLMLSIILVYGALKKLYLWYHYLHISIPETPETHKEWSVDVLTTYFPGEPYEMIVQTLEAIQQMHYPHTTYLCDEADDTFLKGECKRLGVVHVTRNNRIDAKAGNINNALKQASGEICLILDPDHVPEPEFLDLVLPHFEDEGIGFVQVVQAYYNKPDTLVARGASEQTFQFYGPMMMCMNSYGTVNAIGANCTFRRAALDSIGGHAPGLAEDMHTAMLLHAQGWKSVYVPELVAKGLAPHDLTSYYKQQLKWSRGVFELLYSVYPQKFKNFTWRQRIHYALLPLHYLIGFIYLLGFLIPIISLLFSKMPWTGDIVYFAIISLPVLTSSLMIRAFIQKWVIEKYDRGFHVIGGLLQIITWWVFILGVTYTFIRKKVPYLPTPKSEEGTHLAITIPNMAVAAISIFSVCYGLYQDLTPFSLVMAFFASLNALFMFFSVYIALQVTNRNRILRTTLSDRTIESLKKIKQGFIDFADGGFTVTRYLALPILLISLLASGIVFSYMEKGKWNPKAMESTNMLRKYQLGIFHPSEPGGITDLGKVRKFESRAEIDFQLVSFYTAWGDGIEDQISSEYLDSINAMGASPLITWEPWAASFRNTDSLVSLVEKEGIFASIANGRFDEYVRSTATKLKDFEATVYLRFAHEFDNPAYPWYLDDDNTASDFVRAWRHVHFIFREVGANNVAWVWNPWKADVSPATYPGEAYVDWLGVTLLNYGKLNDDDIWHSFTSLYSPFHNTFRKLPQKPVMLAEFGSLQLGGDQELWFDTSFEAINSKFPEINAVVFFNSGFDGNIPKRRTDYSMEYLNWTLKDFRALESVPFKTYDPYGDPRTSVFQITSKSKTYGRLPVDVSIKGINYRKADDWLDNNYIADKDVLKEDFAMMNRLGINTIKYRSSDIYDYNVLKYAAESQIDVFYSFSFPKDKDLLRNSAYREAFRKDVLKRVESLKDEKQIIAWNIEDGSWIQEGREQDSDVNKVDDYLQWLKSLAFSIKQLDPERLLIKHIRISQSPEEQIAKIVQADVPVDAFGIDVDNVRFLKNFLVFAETNDIPYMFNAIGVSDLNDFQYAVKERPVILKNWQNQWESSEISFDGLLDFKGRKKKEFALIAELWGDGTKRIDLPPFRVLRPAVPLLGLEEISYSAMVFMDGGWRLPEDEGEFTIEWRLARYDSFGNIVAIRTLGKGAEISIKAPSNYSDYRIILTLAKDGFSETRVAPLNTPLWGSGL